MAMRDLLKTAMVACAILILSGPARGEDIARPIPIAVADFDYSDTSGEPRDQREEHAARLQAFMRMLRADLERSGKYRIVAFACGQGPCAGARSEPAEMIENARRAGARLLLYGGIHKISTLIQSGKFQVVDLEAGKLVFDRLLSFRGDSDEAWERVERFLARDLTAEDFLR